MIKQTPSQSAEGLLGMRVKVSVGDEIGFTSVIIDIDEHYGRVLVRDVCPDHHAKWNTAGKCTLIMNGPRDYAIPSL